MSLSAALYIDESRRTIASLREAFSNDSNLTLIERTLDDLRKYERDYPAALAAIRANGDYSEPLKARKIEELNKDRAELTALLVGKVADGFQKLVAHLKQQAQPRPLDDNALVAQAQLTNARADAHMMLDGLDKPNLIQKMLELAQGQDETLAYLLLATPFPALYLDSRGAKGFLAEWETARLPYLTRVYSDGAARAAKALPQVQALAETLPESLQALYGRQLMAV